MTVRDIDHFANWLTDMGAEVMPTISEWEVLRVRTNQGTFVVHENKVGKQHWPPGFLEIVSAYNRGTPIPLAAVTRFKRSSKTWLDYGAIVKRDGSGCFYCGEVVAPPDAPVPKDYAATVEHLVCIAHGGPNHLSNKFIAHRKCNEIAGNLSAPEKIRLRDRMQGERAA